MANELRPRGGELPSAMAIAQRLQTEFRYVRIDEVDGAKRAQALAEWIESRPARVFLGKHREALEGAARLRHLTKGDALTVQFGDDAFHAIEIVVIPGQPINFGYRSQIDEEASSELVERCARALECDVVTI